MADNDEERTESATPKRLEEARKRGEIPRSRDLSTAAVMLSGGAALSYMGGNLGAQLHGLMRSSLSLTREQATNEQLLLATVGGNVGHTLLACAPILGLMFLAALCAPLVLGGWVFSTEALAPKFSRLNPIAGFGRLFSMNGVMELAKAIAKFAIVGLVAVIVLRRNLNAMMGLGSEPVDKAVVHAASMCGSALLALGGALGFIALIDVPYQLWSHAKKLRMTRQEIRDEYKESEGSPESKSRIRERQQEMARARMMEEVPKADVVVTNPTHFAVALRYDDKRMRAPIVVAKGADLIAARIRAVAGEHAVPIFEAPPLARLLYRNVDIGGEIPNSVYVAVAQVLTYIYQLKSARKQGMQTPPPPVVEVPEELVPKPEDMN